MLAKLQGFFRLPLTVQELTSAWRDNEFRTGSGYHSGTRKVLIILCLPTIKDPLKNIEMQLVGKAIRLKYM